MQIDEIKFYQFYQTAQIDGMDWKVDELARCYCQMERWVPENYDAKRLTQVLEQYCSENGSIVKR